MTHMSDVTNGASLEDCHTNFFALADLNGIKWRRLCADSMLCFDPMDDPVLVSFSKCLAAGILCVWRRVVTQKSSLHHQNLLQDSNQSCYGKELWIFWYGEESDLTGLVSPELTEADQGSWESGLSYECRTFLFKALHNLIERCLLSRGFTRLGKFFVEPCNVANGITKRTQIVFALHYFIHGDSTVCTCVDARLSSPVYQLNKCHMAAAQNEQTEVQVILSPYGMAGTLTGNGYKVTDLNTKKYLNEWHHFYPNPSEKESFKVENDLPAAVEVVVGGIRMKYPSSYVYITESDHVAACVSNKNQTSTTCLNPTLTAMQFSQPNSKTPATCNVLTPPVSPREPPGAPLSQTSSSVLFPLSTQGANLTFNREPFSEMIKQSVQEECTIPQHQPEGVDEASLLWDFHDPSTVIKCSCTRCSGKPSGAVSCSPNDALPSSQVNHINSAVSRRSDKGDKTSFTLQSVPFHKRKQTYENTYDVSDSSALRINVMHGSESAIVGSGVSAVQLKNLGISTMLGTGTPTSLPQLHTPLTQPSSVDSHSNIPSVDMNCSQTCSSDPIMPTLSPHPPVVKEEEGGGTPAPEIINGGYSTQSPNADIGHTLIPKEKSEELLSPFHSTLLSMLENAKSPVNQSAPLNQLAPAASEDSKSNVTVNGFADVKKNLPTLERPVLPKNTLDDSENTEMVMDGFLYDYSSVSVSLCEPTPPKRRRILQTHIKRELCSEDLYNITNVSGKENTNFTSEASPFTPKDPYEFTDFDETEPSERSFRRSVDICIKEEEKVISPGLPSPPEVSSPLVQAPGSVPPPPPESAKTPTSDPPKAPSPPTPRNVGPKFIREEDLTVTFEDLENIFDTSSSSCDEMFPTPSTPTKASNSVEELCAKKTTGILELSMMFPTPPSLEPNAAPSPLGTIGCSDMSALDNDVKEHRDLFDNPCASPNWEPKDSSSAFVNKLPTMQKFIGSLKYGALNNLLTVNQPVTMPPECVYKVTWLQHSNGPTSSMSLGTFGNEDSPSERQINIGPQCTYVNVEEERVYNQTFSVDHNLDQRSSLLNFELQSQSPASSVSTYLSKHLNSVESNSACSPIPEAHCLLVNLLLSDSLLNIFKDHNFDSCSLCVCNMNIKGADAGIILPNSLIPSGNDEAQYKCTCGFSAVVHRHRSYSSGIFAEDELEVTGFSFEDSPLDKYCYSASALLKKPSFSGFRRDPGNADYVPQIVDLIRIQSKTLCSSFSLFHKSIKYSMKILPPVYNALEIFDGCEVCFLALETGKAALDNMMVTKMDETLKPSCLHKWPYTINPLPANSQEIMVHLDSLKPLLQEAVHKKNPQRLWDTTYVVSGPLTWRQFHRLAARGTEDQCEPQPIPSLMLGYDKDSLTVSPFALKYWDKLLMEPYSMPRDVAYIVVAPENDYVLSHVKSFFHELSSIYELHKMGRHSPITKVLRDGIMRVGKNAATKLADEPIDEWFSLIGDNPVFNKLKLYARVCKHRLAPHLSTLSLDKTLFGGTSSKPAEKTFGVASSPLPSNVDSQDRAPTPKSAEPENVGDSSVNGPLTGSSSSSDSADDDNQQPPALVIYIVEPFTFASVNPDSYRLITLGLLRSYSEMLQLLPESISNSIHLQLVSLDSILCLGKGELDSHRKDELKSLAFSVFSQCQHLLARQSAVKSLTGFGPAASQDLFLSSKGEKANNPIQIFNQTLILASLKDKQTELNEMFGDRREKSSIMYCSYCLTEDRRWLLASCTNDKGEFIETTVINITVPNRTRRKRANVRKLGLRKLLDFILELLSRSIHPWRIVIGRLGRLGHGELRDWASLLSRKNLLEYSRKLRELCRQCSVLGFIDTPSILSACLVSLEPDSALRIMADQYTPDDRFSSSSCHTCDLSTPEDATCTHILVFPTSATVQSCQATFRDTHIDPLPGGLGDDDFLEALNEDDIEVGQEDMDDIFNWADIPTQSPGNPHQDCTSQAGSPVNGRHSPYPHGGPNRSMSMAGDGQEEPLQLAQQPLALGYYVSTAKTGPLPNWFWASCPHLANTCPVFLKSALLIHLPSVQQGSDDLLHANPHLRNYHPLDSHYTTDVLRYVLEGYNTLSWLSLDPNSHDRRSCLPVHIQILMQLYCIIETLL